MQDTPEDVESLRQALADARTEAAAARALASSTEAVHLYEFRAGGTGWGVPDPDFDDGPLLAAKATLFDVIEHTGARTIHYLYDFGDGWDHAVRIERIGEPDPQAL